MKKQIIIVCILSLIACADGYNYKTNATYKAKASKLTVNLIASGHILHGQDLDENGMVNGKIYSSKLADTLYVQANEYHILALTYKKETILTTNSKQTKTSLIDGLNAIGYKDYDKNELIELEAIIKATAYGPKGTYMKQQTKLIQVLDVDFETY